LRKVEGYIVGTKVGHTDDVVEGLFNLANNILKKQGRLVFLFPTDFDE
jgi:tRNA G10  N-methylase Trm11